jgi:hypothetical protein
MEGNGKKRRKLVWRNEGKGKKGKGNDGVGRKKSRKSEKETLAGRGRL